MSEKNVTADAVATLKNRIKQIRSDEGGFTLVEMVVALTVVLLMAGAALLAAPGIIKDSKISACNAKADAVANAIVASYAHNGDYSKADLHSLGATPAVGDANLISQNYLVGAPDANDIIIGTATADGVAVTVGPACQGDFTPSTWGDIAQNTPAYVYKYGDGGDYIPADD